jgi:hypothetical protein
VTGVLLTVLLRRMTTLPRKENFMNLARVNGKFGVSSFVDGTKFVPRKEDNSLYNLRQEVLQELEHLRGNPLTTKQDFLSLADYTEESGLPKFAKEIRRTVRS